MEENIIDNNITDESSILGESAPTPSQQLAQDLLNELQTIAENTEDSSEDNTEDSTVDNEVNTVETIDYSQQLSDINSSVNLLHDDIVSLSQSVDSLQGSIEDLPENIKMQFDGFLDFGYLVLSLNIGFLVAILFFMGLKK